MKAGGDGKSIVFLLTDTQIKDESFLEDVNTLLNTGELPNLYTNEEKAEILEKIQAVAKEEVSVICLIWVINNANFTLHSEFPSSYEIYNSLPGRC